MARDSSRPQIVSKLTGMRTPIEDVEGLASGRHKAVQQGNLELAIQLSETGDIDLVVPIRRAWAPGPGDFNLSAAIGILGECGEILNPRRVPGTHSAMVFEVFR